MAGSGFRTWVDDRAVHGFITDPSSLECKCIMTQSYLICNPSLKKKPKPVRLDRTTFVINCRIRSVQSQFHDDRVFTGAVVMPSQTPFFERKFTLKLSRRQIRTANFQRNQAGPRRSCLGDCFG